MTKEEISQLVKILLPKLSLWSVYALINQEKKEIYFGVSRDPKDRIISYHAKGDTLALSHWNFVEDTIVAALVKKYLSQSEASSLAHSCEDVKIIEDYAIIATSGI